MAFPGRPAIGIWRAPCLPPGKPTDHLDALLFPQLSVSSSGLGEEAHQSLHTGKNFKLVTSSYPSRQGAPLVPGQA